MQTKQRLQKLLATAGIGSRRKIEELIQAGRVCVNSKIAVPGTKVSIDDEITIDSKRVVINAPKAAKLLLYNKPLGEICTRLDDKNRPTVFTNLPKLESGRWINVGRLDVNTSGLLLFTNDGELAHTLMHPRFQLKRTYLARVFGDPVTPQILTKLTTGVMLDDGVAKFTSVKPQNNKWYEVSVMEGKNRLVRRLWQSLDYQVSRLIRISYGTIKLPKSLPPGKYIDISSEITNLKRK